MISAVLTEPLHSIYNSMGLLAQPILYGISLLAVFLLAFRSKRADRVISFFLALLWAWMGFGLLFPIQALIFFVEGTCRGRLDFRSRAGAAPVAGALFLLYSLIVQPILQIALEPGALHLPVHELGFDAVLFTFGLLLFLKEGFPRYILALPLVWAAMGGMAAFQDGGPRDWGLLAALLAGSFLALPGRQRVPDVEGNRRLETWYEHAGRHHRTSGRLLLALILATCLLGFLVAFTQESQHPVRLLLCQLEVSATLLAVLALGLWLSLPAWYSAGFRLLAWEATRWLRGLRLGWAWLAERWGGVLIVALLLLVAVLQFAEVFWQRDAPAKPAVTAEAGKPAGANTAADQSPETNLVLTGFALAALLAIYRARRRIVIEDFHDHTTGEVASNLAKGLASRLRNELSSIINLYRTIDEANPPGKGKIVSVTVGVDGSLERLEDVIGPDSSIEIGKLKIPIGLILSGLSRLVRGPRVTGSLHKDGEQLLLVAELAGGGLSGTWRVSFQDLSEEQRTPQDAAVHRLAEQLAYRIITSLGNLGSPRWEAVRHFTEGLRAYRTTQVVRSDVSPELRRAEKEFINALRQDRNFSQCHYNLGVVYQHLGVHNSAEASYRQVLEEDPDWSEAYYALATVYFEAGKREKAGIFARKMIEIRPGDARGWNLNGVARYAHEDLEARSRRKLDGNLEQAANGPAWDEITCSFKIAAALAWRSLCAAALRSSRPLDKEEQLAVGCATNLGIVRNVEGDGDGEWTILEQVFRLAPRSARARLVRGESLFEEKEWQDARAELFQVFGDALEIEDRVERWIYLLGVHLAQSKWEAAEHASHCILDHAVPPESIILALPGDEDAEADRKRKYGELLDHFEDQLRLVRGKVREKTGTKPPRFDSLLRLIHFLRNLEMGGAGPVPMDHLSTEEREWATTQTRIRDARLALPANPGQARQELKDAIDDLEGKHSRQIERQGLRSLLARACMREADLMEAVKQAEASVAQAPQSAARRWILGDVFSELGDFEEASNERETALSLGPICEIQDDASTLERIALDYLVTAGLSSQPAPEPRIRRGLLFFERVLQLAESRRSTRSEAQYRAHAAAHFWVGRFYCELSERAKAKSDEPKKDELSEQEKGILHLLIARKMRFRPAEVSLRLGNVYSWKRDFDEAEAAFQKALPAAEGNGHDPLLEVEARLSWAMLYAERGVSLDEALALCDKAEQGLPGVMPDHRHRELRALLRECRGWILFQNWILFQKGSLADGLRELEQAEVDSGAVSIQARLARLYDSAGVSGDLDPERAKLKARDARERAKARSRNARNGYGRGVFDLWLSSQGDGEPAGPPG
ncbi:MAG TPA: DUF6064 family protein [Thermoanaerobaculia bacterium]|nr:DUF6064 family protein [Thermoanaerobaculia bacterium]